MSPHGLCMRHISASAGVLLAPAAINTTRIQAPCPAKQTRRKRTLKAHLCYAAMLQVSSGSAARTQPSAGEPQVHLSNDPLHHVEMALKCDEDYRARFLQLLDQIALAKDCLNPLGIGEEHRARFLQLLESISLAKDSLEEGQEVHPAIGKFRDEVAARAQAL